MCESSTLHNVFTPIIEWKLAFSLRRAVGVVCFSLGPDFPHVLYGLQ